MSSVVRNSFDGRYSTTAIRPSRFCSRDEAVTSAPFSVTTFCMSAGRFLFVPHHHDLYSCCWPGESRCA